MWTRKDTHSYLVFAPLSFPLFVLSSTTSQSVFLSICDYPPLIEVFNLVRVSYASNTPSSLDTHPAFGTV